jgi:hypothetical protein
MHVLSPMIERFFLLVSGLGQMSAMTGLLLISAAFGLVAAIVMRTSLDNVGIRKIKRQIYACLYEMRLFEDDPALVLRAQGALLRHNVTYVKLMGRPLLILALPATLLMVHMEAFFGRAPLEVGREAVVTVQYRTPLDLSAAPPRLVVPDGIQVETPAVRVAHEGQVSWRIRPVREVSGSLRVMLNGGSVEKRVTAGSTLGEVSDRRVSSLYASVWHPVEPRFDDPDLEYIEVRYPSRDFALFGVRWNWAIWFLLSSTLFVLLLKRPLKLTF